MPIKIGEKEYNDEELGKYLEDVMKQVTSLKNENQTLKDANTGLQQKLNNIHIDSITSTLGNNKEEPVEEIEFDFDI